MSKMSLIFSKMSKHIAGYKELTTDVGIAEFTEVETVYIPLANGNSTSFDVFVKEGDYVKVGTKLGVRNDWATVPVFSSVSGVVRSIEKHKHGLGEVDHVVIDNDQKFELEEFESFDYEAATREELVEFTKEKGIVGCGGAGFATFIKYQDPKSIDKVIINAVECEPFITADYKEIDKNVEYLVKGSLAMKKMANAKEVVIAIKVGKKLITDKIKAALPDSSITVREVPDRYPMGWERTLIREIEKKEYETLPAELGLIVNNSTTAIALAEALDTGMPIVKKFVTFSGDALKKPQNINVLVGTPVKDLFKIVQPICDDIVLINGGPMMGKSMDNDDFVITPYTNAITVMHEVVTDAIPCLRCGSCSDHCPAGLQPVRIMEAFDAKDWDKVRELRADKCIECGLCSYVCPSKIEVAETVIKAKTIIARLKK